MKLLKIILLTSMVFSTVFSVKSQIYLTEGFETGAKPENWTEETVSGSEPWKYRNGGHSPDDPNWQVPAGDEDITRNPPAAYEGTYNAIFFKEGGQNERTKLVTKELNILGGTYIELSFYLCQVPWKFEGSGTNDVLRVYYKKAADSSWVLLHEYIDEIYEWELQTLVLPNTTSTYYVAFEGHTRWGYGTCIDDIVIEEKGSQSLWIAEMDFEQQFANYIPSGSSDVPMLRIDFKVFGNTDSAMLDSIHFTSLNTSDNDILSNGVKLYSTMTQTFSTESPLGSPTNFASGVASFTGLDYSLPRGQSYMWLAYDIDPNASHGNTLDVMVAANGIMANDTLYPASDQSPDGYRIVYETLYFEDFEGTHNWDTTGEFEVNTPTGMGGSPGNPDPSEAFSGTKVLGTDLTGLGSNLYHYEPNLSQSTSYRATSPTMDAFYYKNLNLFYQRYLNIFALDSSFIQISTNDGATWNTLWASNSYIGDFQWTAEQVVIPDQYSKTDQLKIRYQMGPTDGLNNYSGWNIDDIYLTGEFISKDVGVSEWIYPLSGSGHSANDSVRVHIRNYGGAEITDDVPVAYSFDGGSNWVVDNMTRNIPIGDSVTFTFPTKVDLSVPGLKPSVLARTNLPGDQYTPNDQISTQIYIVPTYLPPYLEDFESNEGYWRIMGNDIWEYGTPDGSVIDTASSGTNSWVTGLSQQYEDLITQKSKIIFEDEFETDRGWTFTGEFERSSPSNMYPPYFAYSGAYCIGTDLSGQGDSLYKYENGIISGTSYTATSPVFDVTNYSNLSVSYASYLNIQSGDSVRLEVSPDNGVNWYTLWKNTEGEIMDEDFQFTQIPVHDSLSYTSALRLRFSLFYSSASGWVAAGWNIDDFTLFGDQVNPDPAYLTSPSYDLTGLTKPVFETRLWWDTEPDVDGATMLYSLDDGDTWTAISNTSGYDAYWNWYTGNSVSELALDGWSGQSGGWLTVKHLLPPAVINQDNVQFRFKFMADKVNNQYDGIAVDDIRIIEAPEDIGVLEIVAPVSACELSSNQAFTLRLRNYGIRSLQPGDTIQVGYYIDRSGEIQTAVETILLTQTFPIGTNQDFTMATGFDFDKSGDYQTDVYTIEVDPYFYQTTSNDTISQLISVIKPAVELGPDIYTVRPDTVILMAYSGVSGHDYLWQDASTDSVYHVSTEGTYYVRVTNDIPCVASDTIKVIQLIADAGVTNIMEPASDCELGASVHPKIEVTNFGTDTLHIGNEIPVRYRIDGDAVVEETAVLAELVNPDSSFEYTFTTSSDMSAVKTYSITAFTDLPYDNTNANDTLKTSVEVYGYTPIDLGPDTVVRALQYTIDAGAGYDTYLWQDGSANQTLIVDTTGQYRVTVKEGTKCENSDSLLVTIIIPDIAIERLSNPADACGLSATENLDIYVINTGTDTLNTSDTILISYQVNAGTMVYDTLFVDRRVEPEDSVLFSSSETVDLSGSGIYQFTVNAFHSKDLIPGNNSLDQSIEIYGYPDVSLGDDLLVNAKTHTLDAGTGYISYLWQDGSTGQQFIIEFDKQTSDSSYSVTVTDENGCKTVDEVKIGFDIWDIGIASILSPTSACVLTDQEELRVLIKNTGSNPILNEQIKIVASVDNGIPVTGQKTLTQALNPGDSLEFLFGHTFDFSGEGDHTLTAYSIYAKDSDPHNDTMIVVITHYGIPAIELGGVNDSLGTTLPHTLDAGADYVTYLWNGIAGSRTYNATVYGWYTLEVTDQQGCTGTDSVYLMQSTGIGDYRLPGRLKVYPIPTDKMLYIDYRSPESEHLFLDIFDARGRKILVKEYRKVNEIMESIDVSGMHKGLYFLKLRSVNRQIIRQIVIQ